MGTKINKLRQQPPSNGILLTSWLEKSGFSRSEVSNYIKSGWLQRIATGVYQFAGDTPSLYSALASYQKQAALKYHIGAASALELKGFSHYIAMGKPTAVVFSPVRPPLPKWLNDADLDRKRTFLILRRIWQTDSDVITSEQLTTAIQRILDHKFFVDCYALSRNSVCFAERMNQVLINFDGKIFKCSTLSSFDDKHAMGKLDLLNGEISWEMNKIAHIPRTMTNSRCSDCSLFPSCLGPCNKNLLKSPDRSCILDEMNLSMQEFLMYNFKLNLLHENFDYLNN